MSRLVAVKRITIPVDDRGVDDLGACFEDLVGNEDDVGFIARHVVVIFIALLVVAFGAVLVTTGQQLRDRVSIAMDIDAGRAR